MTGSRWRTLALVVIAGTAALATTACTAPPLPSIASGKASAGDRHWAPRAGLRWQIQLRGAFDPDPRANVYDLDAYATSEQTVAGLRAAGRQTICHLDVGVSDLDLPDAARLPARVLGAADGPGRRWLDIRAWDVIEPVLADRIRLCRDKGFDAVDADLGYGYTARTGFGLTATDQVTYDRRVAALTHSLGLAVTVRTRPDLAAQVEPDVDFTVADGCFRDSACHAYFVYIDAGKAVFDLETSAAQGFCALARAYGFSAIRKHTQLDAFVQNC